MCYSFNKAENRGAYLADPEGYVACFGLNEGQKRACRDRDVPAMIASGGNIYCLARFAGIYRLNMQDIGAQQSGMSVEEFKEKRVRQGD